MSVNYEIVQLPKDKYNKLYCNLLYYYYYYKYELNEGKTILTEMIFRMWLNNNKFF